MKKISLFATLVGLSMGLVASSDCGNILIGQDLFNLPDPDSEPQAQPNDDPIVVRPAPQPAPRNRFQAPADLAEEPGQAVTVRDRYAGWEQAGPSDDGRRLSTKLRSNWVMVDLNGTFRGRVVPMENASLEGMVVYLLNMGRIVKEVRVESDGYFEFNNVEQNPYALVGWGANGFFAFGLTVLEFREESRSQMANSVRVLAFQNETSINTDLVKFFAPKVVFRVFGRYDYAEGEEDPKRLYGIEGLSNFGLDAQPATSIDGKPVVRTASGGLLGRVHQMTSESGRPIDIRNTRIILLQDDDVVAATDVDNFGVFYFPQVEVGQYGLAAAGADGMGLIGFDLVDNNSVIEMDAAGEIVTGGDNDPFPFDFTLVSPETVGWMNHYATDLDYRRNLFASQKRRLSEMAAAQQGACANCEGAGCNNCGGSGICNSRSQQFEDWAASCLGQQERTKLGSGFILSEASKDIRRLVNRGNSLFETAFYGASGQGGGLTTPGLDGGVGNDFFNGGGTGFDSNVPFGNSTGFGQPRSMSPTLAPNFSPNLP